MDFENTELTNLYSWKQENKIIINYIIAINKKIK